MENDDETAAAVVWAKPSLRRIINLGFHKRFEDQS